MTLLAADVSPLVAKCEDPKMAEDPGVSQVVKQLDKACKEAGFFYVVIFQFPVHVLWHTLKFKIFFSSTKLFNAFVRLLWWGLTRFIQ